MPCHQDLKPAVRGLSALGAAIGAILAAAGLSWSASAEAQEALPLAHAWATPHFDYYTYTTRPLRGGSGRRIVVGTLYPETHEFRGIIENTGGSDVNPGVSEPGQIVARITNFGDGAATVRCTFMGGAAGAHEVVRQEREIGPGRKATCGGPVFGPGRAEGWALYRSNQPIHVTADTEIGRLEEAAPTHPVDCGAEPRPSFICERLSLSDEAAEALDPRDVIEDLGVDIPGGGPG